MNVKITHTVDLDSIPDRSLDLIQPALKDISKSLEHLKMLEAILRDADEDDVSLAVQHMDIARRRLANADTILGECHSILAGVNDYNLEQTQKKLMEQKLEQQEREYAAQQQQEQQASQANDEPTAPPVRKLWDPKTKTTSIIEEGEG